MDMHSSPEPSECVDLSELQFTTSFKLSKLCLVLLFWACQILLPRNLQVAIECGGSCNGPVKMTRMPLVVMGEG
jgi:hypothetical protein